MRTIPYNPSLDGLRAVAVMAVMLYHGGVWWAPGGFLGVDVFFVLSGYLITALLLVERDRTGRIDLKAFWIRRGRRLLPALGAVILAVVVYAVYVADPSQADQLRGDALATLGYVANWRFVFDQSSYFDQFLDPSPLRHMWSLGIEEQWYLIWPIVFTVVIARWGRTTLLVGAACLALASAGLMAVLFDPAVDPSRLYYGTDTRVQGLLVGALMALALGRIELTAASRRIRSGLGVVGAILIGFMLYSTNDTDAWMYRGGFLLIALAAAAVVLSVLVDADGDSPSGPVARLLALRPLPAVGRISYGLYLWHWPVYVYLSPERVGFGGDGLLFLRIGVTFVVSLASYALIEMPVRRGALQRMQPRLLTGGATAGVVLLLVMSTAGTAGVADSSGPLGAGDIEVLVVGDSVGHSLASNFDPSMGTDLTVSNASILGCGILRGRAIGDDGRLAPSNPACDLWPETWSEKVASIEPDVSLVVVAGWGVVDREIDGRRLEAGTDDYLEAYRGELRLLIQTLTSRGGQVVLALPACTEPGLQAVSLNRGPSGDALTEEDVQVGQDWTRERFEEFRNRPGVRLVDLGELGCPEGRYEAEVDGVDLRPDGVHYGPVGAAAVWGWLAPQLLEF